MESLTSNMFYSLPCSPITSIPNESPPCTHQNPDDTHSEFYDFEFQTAFQFGLECQEHHHTPHRKIASLPAMSFADELFCDGKIMPLKPPPSHGYSDESSLSNQSSSSSLSSRFKRQSLWNDQFDPFMAAPNNVRDEQSRGKIHRRARSMSPISPIETETMGPVKKLKQRKGVVCAKQAREQRKGVVRAKQAREQLAMVEEMPTKAKKNVIVAAKRAKECKPNKMKSSKEEETNKSIGLVEFNGGKRREPQVTKMALIHFRPKLFQCLGYGRNIR